MKELKPGTYRCSRCNLIFLEEEGKLKNNKFKCESCLRWERLNNKQLPLTQTRL